MSESMYKNPQEPKKQEEERKKRNKKGLFIFLGILAAVILIALLARAFTPKGETSLYREEPFSSGTQNVAKIYIEGTIEEDGATYNQEWVTGQIRNAMYDKDNKGIMLVINSPGGTVYESDETWQRLMDYKKETNRPVYAYMEQMAASGGYYIASPADKIFINRNGITGSIGVIGGMSLDASKLMEDLGIKADYIHTGDNKVMGNLFQPMTEEQRNIMQQMSDEAYGQFIDVIAEGRKMDKEKIKALADGRIYTAKQASENGLVDGVGEYEDFEQRMIEDQGLGDKVRFVDKEYKKAASFWQSMLGAKGETVMKALSGDKISATMETLNELKIDEPMYLYQK